MLVHDEDHPKYHEIMTEMGYTRLAHEFEWFYEKNQVELEFHSAFKRAYGFIIGQTDIWNYAENKGPSKHFKLDPKIPANDSVFGSIEKASSISR